MIDDPRLSRRARTLILEASSVFVSAASVWEVSIKHALRKRQMPHSGAEALVEFRAAGFELLAISAEHAAAVDALPLLHLDPFDRMLVAQARSEPLTFLTHDARLAPYSDLVVVV